MKALWVSVEFCGLWVFVGFLGFEGEVEVEEERERERGGGG